MSASSMLLTIDAHEPIDCGKDAAKHFSFRPGYLNLNHGSYGACPVQVRTVYRDYQALMDARPDAFTRYEYRPHLLDASRQVLADYLRVPLDTCVLVPNASTAFDTILRNMVFHPGDVVLCFDIGYESFANTLQYLSETTPMEYATLPLDLTLSDDNDDQICSTLRSAISNLRAAGKNPRMAVFDTISSLPAVRLPFEKLTALCKTQNVLSCIDGAHGIGQLDIDLATLDPDFFTSNLHKWLYVPRPCAVLYVPERNQEMLRSTLPTGFSFLPQDSEIPMRGKAFAANFQSVGTLEDAPYLCVRAALDWRQRIRWEGKRGEEAVQTYLQDLASEGGKRAAHILGTEVLASSPYALTTVRLPLSGKFQVDDAAAYVMRRMIEEHQIAVVVSSYREAWWVRLCAQVYLTLEDFERAAMLLRDLCEGLVEERSRAGS